MYMRLPLDLEESTEIDRIIYECMNLYDCLDMPGPIWTNVIRYRLHLIQSVVILQRRTRRSQQLWLVFYSKCICCFIVAVDQNPQTPRDAGNRGGGCEQAQLMVAGASLVPSTPVWRLAWRRLRTELPSAAAVNSLKLLTC